MNVKMYGIDKMPLSMIGELIMALEVEFAMRAREAESNGDGSNCRKITAEFYGYSVVLGIAYLCKTPEEIAGFKAIVLKAMDEWFARGEVIEGIKQRNIEGAAEESMQDVIKKMMGKE